MDKVPKLLLEQMKSKKFRQEDDEIKIHLASDGFMMTLVRVLICLAVGIEVIDKISPSVKCFPIGRTWYPVPNRSDSVKYIRDYNYQQFLNIYCETDISDYTNYNGYKEWKKTCPTPAGDGPKTQKCSPDLDQKNTASVQNCTWEAPESIMAILRSKKISFGDLFKYLFTSLQNPNQIYDCRPRTLYYYYMSWTILIYGLMVGMGPTLWNFVFGRKIADRIRHIKEFIDTINNEDQEKKKEMVAILRSQVSTWNSGGMMFVAIAKSVVTLFLTLLFVALFVRGFRGDIEDLAFTVCKVHNYEYAKCASARVGLIYFVWWFCLVTLCLIFFLCVINLWTLLGPGRKEKMFLVNLLKNQFGIDDVDKSKCVMCAGCAPTRCCSDLVLMSVLCETNRGLFGKAWRRFNRQKTLKKKFGFAYKISLDDSVRFSADSGEEKPAGVAIGNA